MQPSDNEMDVNCDSGYCKEPELVSALCCRKWSLGETEVTSGSYRKKEICISGGDYFVLFPQVILFSLNYKGPRKRPHSGKSGLFRSNPPPFIVTAENCDYNFFHCTAVKELSFSSSLNTFWFRRVSHLQSMVKKCF